MGTKDLKEKAIDIHGKQYVMVSDRIVYFNEAYTRGMIVTELLSEPTADMVVVKAIVTPDTNEPKRFFTGHSQAKWGDGYINKTSAMENAETSAVGRALALMGIGVLDSIASVDEINKAQTAEKSYSKPAAKVYAAPTLTVPQKKHIQDLLKQKGKTQEDLNHLVGEAFKITDWQTMTVAQGSMVIKKIMSLPDPKAEPELEDVDTDAVMEAIDKMDAIDSPEAKK